MSPLPAQMEDHWSLVPGVDPGRARLMWFMRVGDNPQVAELARLGQARLAGLAGLDGAPGVAAHDHAYRGIRRRDQFWPG